MNQRKQSKRERCSSKTSYTQFNGVRKPPKSPGNQRDITDKDTSFEGDMAGYNKMNATEHFTNFRMKMVGERSPPMSHIAQLDDFYDTTDNKPDEKPMTMPTTPKKKMCELR